MPVRISSSDQIHANLLIEVSDTKRSAEKKVRKNFFPHVLLQILSSSFFSDCAAWTCDGKAFFITNPEGFSNKYASFFHRKTASRKESFARKLNRWGFKMELNKGPLCGSYSHPLFNRNEPWLCEQMTCNKKRGLNHSDLSSSSHQEGRPSKKRKHSLSAKELSGSENDNMCEIYGLYGGMYGTAMKAQKTSEDALYPQSDTNDKEVLISEALLRNELRVQQMMKLFGLKARARNAYPGDVLEQDNSYAQLHNTIVKNAMMALV